MNRRIAKKVLIRRSPRVNAAAWRIWLQENNYLWEVWDAARDSRNEGYYVLTRRAGLKKLRRMIGEEAYWTGTLPPPVPLWRFRPMP